MAPRNAIDPAASVFSLFHRTAVAGTSLRQLGMMVTVPQPAFLGGQVPDVGAYLSFPRKQDGGLTQTRKGSPGELGLWWEIKEFDIDMSIEVYKDIVVHNISQIAAQGRQAWAEFANRQALYSILSAGLAFSLFFWPRRGKKRFQSRTGAAWTHTAQESLSQEIDQALQDWKVDYVATIREAAGNSVGFQAVERRFLSKITLEYLLEMSPVPIYYRQNMLVGKGANTAPSPQLAKAFFIAHSVSELGLQFKAPSPFDLPNDESLYAASPGTLKEGCIAIAEAIVQLYVVDVWMPEFENVRPPDGPSATPSNDNFRGARRRRAADAVTTRSRAAELAGAVPGPAPAPQAQAVAGPGPATQANRARRVQGG